MSLRFGTQSSLFPVAAVAKRTDYQTVLYLDAALVLVSLCAILFLKNRAEQKLPGVAMQKLRARICDSNSVPYCCYVNTYLPVWFLRA